MTRRRPALRDLGEAAKANEELVTALLPLDNGLLVAVKKGAEA
ncbi:MAG: hypothetical protein V9E85_05405 [Candidatus Nanopelagicales bacterium]